MRALFLPLFALGCATVPAAPPPGAPAASLAVRILELSSDGPSLDETLEIDGGSYVDVPASADSGVPTRTIQVSPGRKHVLVGARFTGPRPNKPAAAFTDAMLITSGSGIAKAIGWADLIYRATPEEKGGCVTELSFEARAAQSYLIEVRTRGRDACELRCRHVYQTVQDPRPEELGPCEGLEVIGRAHVEPELAGPLAPLSTRLSERGVVLEDSASGLRVVSAPEASGLLPEDRLIEVGVEEPGRRVKSRDVSSSSDLAKLQATARAPIVVRVRRDEQRLTLLLR